MGEIKFYKLLDLLNRKSISKEELRIAIGASSATISKLSKNENVSMDVIEKICRFLDCQPGDIMEYIPETKND
jgi:DNA-binding Xre family transcriptional regulator